MLSSRITWSSCSRPNPRRLCMPSGGSLRTLMGYAAPKTGKPRATLLPGDGIGPEMVRSVVGVLQAAGESGWPAAAVLAVGTC